MPSMDGGTALGWHRDPAALSPEHTLSTLPRHYLCISGSKAIKPGSKSRSQEFDFPTRPSVYVNDAGSQVTQTGLQLTV